MAFEGFLCAVMRISVLLASLSLAATLLAETPASKPPVVVELFTSEGCSSCPPADKLLAELEKQLGAAVILLSEHVDYWDHIGWRDPFSSPDFSQRQRVYSQTLGGDDGAYTPQMVVDGRTGFLGSDGRRALSEIQKAAAAPKTAVTLERRGGKIAISTGQLPKNATVLLAITESNLETDVRRGENSGRKLRHTAVVRSLASIGKASQGKAFTAEVQPKVDRSWKRQDLRVVVLLEDKSSHQILGAASAPFAE